jgi:leader peptidase (prepilin peptidase) / N-methyltransferase
MIVELVTAVSFVLTSIQYPVSSIHFWAQILFISFLIVIGAFDFNHYLILDKVVFPALVLAVIWNILLDLISVPPWSILHSYFLFGILGAVVVAGFFGFQYLISGGRWIGFGDVKLGLFIGMLLGVKPGIVMLILGYFLGAAVGVTLIVLGKKDMTSKMPFGVFLSTATIIVLLYGPQISNWYFKLIGF